MTYTNDSFCKPHLKNCVTSDNKCTDSLIHTDYLYDAITLLSNNMCLLIERQRNAYLESWPPNQAIIFISPVLIPRKWQFRELKFIMTSSCFSPAATLIQNVVDRIVILKRFSVQARLLRDPYSS